jgi:hypothetical protein
MLSVFGDESSDETKQRVFSVGGVIGPEELWNELEVKWVSRTKGIPFHAKECDSDQGDYPEIDHDANKALYKDLTILLAESGLGGYGSSIDLSAQRRVFPGAHEFAYYRCFVEVVEQMTMCAAANKETVKFTFDMRRESEYNTGLLYDMIAKIPEVKKHVFNSIAFECSRENPRLQIGDLFTREVMKALDNEIGPIRRGPRKSWLALYNTGRFQAKSVSDEYFLDLKRQMPQLEADTGMSEMGYVKWLREYKLQNNISNRLRYVDWTGSDHSA